MALRAVIFDYGKVLSLPQDEAAHAEAVRLLGIPVEKFEELYWRDRIDYDSGALSGTAFWQEIVRDGNANLPESAVHDLVDLDIRMWIQTNPRMIAWQETLRQHGIKRAILSNMGDTIQHVLSAKYDWVRTMDALIWSYQLRIVKPDHAIYRHAVEKVGVKPEEALFLDDKDENTAAAREVGMKAITFSTADKLREDLIAAGLDTELPLP